MTEKKLTVEELVKALRCCAVAMSCTDCPLHGTFCGGVIEVARKAADALERLNDFEHSSCMKLLAKNKALKRQLAAALAENTKLAKRVVPAHWTGEEMTCSRCGRSLDELHDAYSYFSSDLLYDNDFVHFCPFCGAKMDEGREEKTDE